MEENDGHPPAEAVAREPAAGQGEFERASYQVRVPVVFDHLNGGLLDELNRQKIKLLQALGRGGRNRRGRRRPVRQVRGLVRVR